jgi:hypothetical protein
VNVKIRIAPRPAAAIVGGARARTLWASMIMQDQSRRLREPLTWGRRERAAVAVLVAVLLAGAAALVAFGLTAGAGARRDCIDVTFASTLGAAEEHACGAQARAVCAAPHAFRSSAAQLREACDRAGFRYGG